MTLQPYTRDSRARLSDRPHAPSSVSRHVNNKAGNIPHQAGKGRQAFEFCMIFVRRKHVCFRQTWKWRHEVDLTLSLTTLYHPYLLSSLMPTFHRSVALPFRRSAVVKFRSVRHRYMQQQRQQCIRKRQRLTGRRNGNGRTAVEWWKPGISPTRE